MAEVPNTDDNIPSENIGDKGTKENKKAKPYNVGCSANFYCVNDTVGPTIETNNTLYHLRNAGKESEDLSVQKGSLMKAQQINKLDEGIRNDTYRRRLQPKHTTTVNAQTGQEILYDETIKKIKENLYRITKYELPVSKNSLARADDIQDAYQKLRNSENTCVCNERCTCNARGGENLGCQCNTRTSQPTCICNTDCQCNSRCPCNCNNRTGGCHSKKTCSCESVITNCSNRTSAPLIVCESRCNCDARTTVECACNIRNVCLSFINN